MSVSFTASVGLLTKMRCCDGVRQASRVCPSSQTNSMNFSQSVPLNSWIYRKQSLFLGPLSHGTPVETGMDCCWI